MRVIRTPSLASVLIAGALCCPGAALGQLVDYGALQDAVGEPVTTSVTGKPQRASELPASAVIVTRDQIARSPARDVPGLLKTYTGIDVNRWTAGQSDVAVRGGVQTYNARLLVLVDGRQVYLDHYGMTDWNLLGVQLEEIQQIELVRGPAAALFGFNAAAGVVNIITRRPAGGAYATAAASAGNKGFGRIAASAGTPLTDQLAVKLTAGRLREDERRVPADVLVPGVPDHLTADQVSGELSGRFGGAGVTLQGGYATNRQAEYLPSQLLSNQRFRSGDVQAAYTQDTDWGGLTLGGYVNWLDASYGVQGTNGQDNAALVLNNRIASVRGAGLYRLDANTTVRLGAEYRDNRMRSLSQFSRAIAYGVGSLNAMLDMHPTDDVAVTAAARIDRLALRQSGAVILPTVNRAEEFDRQFTRVSFNAAVLLKAGETGQVRLNGGRGYQLPSLINFGLRVPIAAPTTLPTLIAGRPEIMPSATWSAELAYSRALGGTRVEAGLFWTRVEDAIASPGDGLQDLLELVLTPSPVAVARFLSVGNYTTRGVEASVAGRTLGMGWRANYTFTDTNGDLAGTELPIPAALSPRSTTARHKANLELSRDAGAWYATGVARYTSPTRQFSFTTEPRLRLFHVDEAVALDARIGVRLGRGLEMFAAGENLTGAGGAAGSPIPADTRVRGGLRLAV